MNNTIIIAQRAYDCTSVSVNNISKACKEIQELSLHCNNITELCNSMDTPTICNALSLLFAGNLSLAKDFSLGQRTELEDTFQILFSDILLNAQKYGIMAQKICEMTATAKK